MCKNHMDTGLFGVAEKKKICWTSHMLLGPRRPNKVCVQTTAWQASCLASSKVRRMPVRASFQTILRIKINRKTKQDLVFSINVTELC